MSLYKQKIGKKILITDTQNTKALNHNYNIKRLKTRQGHLRKTAYANSSTRALVKSPQLDILGAEELCAKHNTIACIDIELR